MSFDPNLPANTTKIRNAPTLLQNNFGAIQDGDSSFLPRAINLYDRDVAGVSSDPTAIADVLITYSKTADSISEMFTIDEDSNVIQLTSAGKLGGPTTALKAATIQFGTNTKTNNQNAMVSAWAYVNGTSPYSAVGNGFSTFSRPETGIYRCQFTASHMASSNYGIFVTGYGSSAATISAQVTTSATRDDTEFSVKFFQNNAAVNVQFFSVVVVGGRT